MFARGRVITVVLTVIGVALALTLLSLTAWHPVKHDVAGNTSLGITSEFDGTVRSPVSDFYNPPPGWGDVADGSVLKSEPISDAPPGVRAWRLMYASRDNNNQPVAITAYYAEPDRDTLTGFPLVGLAHGTTGLVPECGMSQAPFTPGTTGYEYWNFLGRQMVANGYAIVVTDYEGMGAPGTPTYLLRKQGYDMLDSLRAALRFRPQTIDGSNLGMIGHSEGGFVVLAASDMLTSYAPELMVRGAVSIAPGGVPPIPFGINALVASTGSGGAGPRNGYVSYLATSWSASYPDILSPDSFFTPVGAQEIPIAAQQCQGEIVQTLDQPITTYFKSDLPLSIITVAAQNQPITQRTGVPTLFIQGALDTGIVPQVTRAFANQMCAYGSEVDYRQLPGDTHRSSVFSSVPDWTDWLDDRFAGESMTSVCKGL